MKRSERVFESSEIKQRSEGSQTIHLNSSESKNTVVNVVRYFILTVVKKDSIMSVILNINVVNSIKCTQMTRAASTVLRTL